MKKPILRTLMLPKMLSVQYISSEMHLPLIAFLLTISSALARVSPQSPNKKLLGSSLKLKTNNIFEIYEKSTLVYYGMFYSFSLLSKKKRLVNPGPQLRLNG